MRVHFPVGLILVAIVFSGVSFLTTAFAEEKSHATMRSPPNIIVIMSDDLGFGDVSCNGAKTFATPNIDQLASEGIRFSNGYCSAATCTPTRFSFLTGTYAFRQKGTGVAPPNCPSIISPSSETLPRILKRAGYRTGVVGKWHLGLGGRDGPDWNGEIKPGPLELGFDYCFLLPTSNDRVPQVFVENHRVLNLDPKDPLYVSDNLPDEKHPIGKTRRDTLRLDWDVGHNGTIHNGISRIGFYTGGNSARFRDEDLGDEWVNRSIRFIEDSKDRPFFLFFASHDLHVPRMPHERFQGKTQHGFRGDAILELDWCVGELIKTLDRLQLAENTLVLFCSDNGPVLNDGYKDQAVETLGEHQPSGPFRGGKYSVFEGGTRIPFITRWKGRIKPNVSDEVVCTIDLAASFAAITSQTIDENGCLDSMNVLGALLGEGKGRESLIQQDNNGTNLALRKGAWKLIRTKNRNANNSDKKAAVVSPFEFQLYDLNSDPSETNDISSQHPDLVDELGKELEESIVKGRTRQ